MSTTVHDPVRPLDPPPRPTHPPNDTLSDRRTLPLVRNEPRRRPATRVPPNAPADDVRAALRARGGETSFVLASRGGYARTVTGRVAFLDEDAQTYIVMGDDGELFRVPLRDITSWRDTTPNESDRLHSDDAEGLGTGR